MFANESASEHGLVAALADELNPRAMPRYAPDPTTAIRTARRILSLIVPSYRVVESR
jgi:hypothetical protein